MVEFFGAVVLVFAAYRIYAAMYLNGEKFSAIKNGIAKYTKNCNDLNEHIEDLKSSYADVGSVDYGDSQLHDLSNYNMKRRRWKDEERGNRTHSCSAAVCKNANNQPFKYLCKYFDIKTNEETLALFESVVNNFSAVEQGKNLLKGERDAIIERVESGIPSILMYFSKERIIRALGFNDIDLSDLYFPVYTFQYISAGGNSSSKCEIKLDVENLDRFVVYLNELVKFRKSVAGQRALITSSLREKIKQRDGFSCRICAISVAEEKHLLLEIDHIIPLAKGGITSEENLQALCWKCNRSKGAKLFSLNSAIQQ